MLSYSQVKERSVSTGLVYMTPNSCIKVDGTHMLVESWGNPRSPVLNDIRDIYGKLNYTRILIGSFI